MIRINALNRAFAVFLAAVIFMGAWSFAVPISSAAENFIDTVGHWADDEIREAVDYGYIRGYADGRFYPDEPIKRSEFVKIINTAMGFTDLGNIAFNDVPYNEWYYDEVRKAAAAGYISGYGNGEWFAPNNPMSREEVAAVLYRVSPGSGSAKAPKKLKDSAEIGDWALTAVSAAYSNGYLTGYPDGNFYPKRNLTRAETVKVINKVLGIDEDARAITSISVSDTTDVKTVSNFISRSSGTLYWILIKRDADIPTPTQVSQGKDSSGAGAINKGNIKVTAFEPVSAALTSLEPGKPYNLCAVLKASSGKLSSVKTLGFSTVEAASVGENWLNRFSVGNPTQDSAVLTAQSSEKGTLYWVVVENRSAGRPSQANIAGGKDKYGDAVVKSGSAELERNVSYTADITGLKSGNTYQIYGYVSKAANSFSRVESGSFSTGGVNTPSLSGFTANWGNDNRLEMGFTVNTTGKFYWIAVSESDRAFAPTAEKIKAGSANSNQTVADKGSFDVTKTGSVTVTKAALSAGDPLQPNVKYRIYACFENPSGSFSGVVSTGLIEKSTVAGGLSGLTISAGGRAVTGFSFDASVYDYTGVEVPNGSKTLVLRPVAGNTVDIIIGGRIASNNSNFNYSMPASAGTPDTIIIETSEAGKTKKTYRIAVKENVPEVKSVYVSGSDPSEPVKDSSGNYSVNVPDTYSEITMSITLAPEMTASLITANGTRTAIKSGERKKLNLESPPTLSTVIQMEIKGPSQGGETRVYNLTVTRTAPTVVTPVPVTPAAVK
ncbi:MAG: S-layer homology domain-containing protein [Clostridiales Family XIII bacterium]|nr:S-layer homology domain-containing protein [Clostridiales Family XIII bacterium]